MKTITIYTAVVTHKHGNNLYQALSEEGLFNQLIEYVEQEWEAEIVDRPIPSEITIDEVYEYFQENDREFLEIYDPATLPFKDQTKTTKEVVGYRIADADGNVPERYDPYSIFEHYDDALAVLLLLKGEWTIKTVYGGEKGFMLDYITPDGQIVEEDFTILSADTRLGPDRIPIPPDYVDKSGLSEHLYSIDSLKDAEVFTETQLELLYKRYPNAGYIRFI